MNNLEETILAALTKKMEGIGELIGDIASVGGMIAKPKQTPEDWTRLAEKAVTPPAPPAGTGDEA